MRRSEGASFAIAGVGVGGGSVRRAIPLRRRPRDLLFVAFFLLNLCFIPYIVDVEQLIIADPAHFQYPLWPPAPLVDLVHWWGRTFDPLLLARPVWWKMTIWIDALGFGPFYTVALYAFLRGRDWIRIPTIIWASVLMTNVTIILGEELAGPHATPQPAMVILANLPWLLVPAAAIVRMTRRDHPFTEAVAAGL
jgi:EXPERA (EXPanded EBP superfamily)